MTRQPPTNHATIDIERLFYIGEAKGCFAENRAWLCRQALNLKGAAAPRSVYALIDWLGDAVEVRQVLGARPRCIVRPDGGALIYAPLLADERMEAMALLHEIGHWLSYGGWLPVAGRLRTHAPDAEREADRFLRAFLLPAPTAQALQSDADAQEVSEITALPVEIVELRREETERWEKPNQAPPWSASGFYRVQRVRTPLCTELLVQDRHSRWRVMLPGDFRRLRFDLAALRPGEFRAKWNGHRPRVEAIPEEWATVAA